jgi:hypothetical protein
VGLAEDLEGVAAAAASLAAGEEKLAAVIPTEAVGGARVYLCAFEAGEERAWVALDALGEPVSDRRTLRDAVSIAALCELAEESAAGGKPDELRAQLAELGRVEGHDLVAEADEALQALQDALEAPPRVASAAYLDRIGAATRVLEQALGEIGASPFAEAMKQGVIAVEGLTAEVEGAYKLPLG